jgi:hypothetical protein
MERRVKEGARFIAFLDGPTAPLLVPATFAPPFQLQRTVMSEAGDQLLSGGRKLFMEGDASDLATVRFRRHYQNQVLEGRGGDVLLSYADGSAALTFSSVGKGAAVFANFPLTPDGGDFIGHPMFPATVHELLRLLRRGAEERAVTPGNAWTVDVPISGEAAVTVSDPDGKKIEAQVLASGRTKRLALPAAHLPGAYLVKQGDQVVGTAVVNVDPRESDTRPIALENLKSETGAAVSVVRDEQELLLAGKTRPLWPELAGAAATFFGLEMLLLAIWRRPINRSSSPEASAMSPSPLNGERAGVRGEAVRVAEEVSR